MTVAQTSQLESPKMSLGKKARSIVNLPNLLTLGRVLAVPLLVALLHFAPRHAGIDGRLWFTTALTLTLLAGLTDALDGWVARRYQIVTRFGRFFDPVADKLLTTGVFVMLAVRGWIAGWIVVLILCREISVMALRMILATDGCQVHVSKMAKVKTIFQVVAMVGLLLVLSLEEVSAGGWVGIPVRVIDYFRILSHASVWVALLLTLSTGMEYFAKNWPHFEVVGDEGSSP